MKEKLKIHLWTLPRWFALPIAASSVLLGSTLGGGISWVSGIAVLCGLLLMCWAHSMNTLLDWSWTGFDKGAPDERSRPKLYTEGQQTIAEGLISIKDNMLNALAWLALSAVCAIIITWEGYPWVWLPWGLIVPMTFWYSWAKLRYHPELPLGLGFGCLATMLGMACSVTPNFGLAFMAGIPMAIMFGVCAEVFDQHIDADTNWPRGLRSLGALAWKNEVSISSFLGWCCAVTYIVQFALVTLGILSPVTALSLLALPAFAFCLLFIESDETKGVVFGLTGIMAYCLLLMAGQIIA